MSSRFTTLALALLTAAVPLACAAQEAPTAATPDAASTTVATINGEPITEEQLEAAVGSRLVSLEQQIYQTRIEGIQELAFQRVLEAAAEKAGLDRAEYYASQVTRKVGEPADEMVQSVLQQYRDRLPQDDAQARAQVVAFLKQQETRRLDAELRERLLGQAELVVMVDPPRADSEPAAFNPAKGPADAPVTLVEFSDFQCPFCQRVQPTLTAIMERYPGKVRHVFRQLPLDMHEQARLAAEASLCAADQGKFWELHDWMFANQREISQESLATQAGALGLDVEAFTSCLAEDVHVPHVEQDLAEAARLGISGTPGFLINGRMLSGAQPLPTFLEIVEDELRRKGITVEEPESAPETPSS